jgi:hypothetical protein
LTCFEYTDLAFTNGGVFQIVTLDVSGIVTGSMCPAKMFSFPSTTNYGVQQAGGVMRFQILGTGTVDINISDWTTYPTCP